MIEMNTDSPEVTPKKWSRIRNGVEFAVLFIVGYVLLDWREFTGRGAAWFWDHVSSLIVIALFSSVLFAVFFPVAFRSFAAHVSKRSDTKL
jgi:hypothetical protein